MAIQGYGKRGIQNGVDNRTPFKVGNVSGKWYDSWQDVPKGQLPGSYTALMRDELKGCKFYVVFSYRTPIAWLDADLEWHMPSYKYSATTTNHQSVVFVAIDNRGFYADAKW